MDQGQGIPPGYWEMLKQKLSGIAQAPINAGRQAMQNMGQVMPTDPSLRQGVPPEAQAANIDPNSEEFRKRQLIARLLSQAQGQGQGQGQPMQAQPPSQFGGQITQQNPAGIRF